ncbi:MAG TPA: hypothetical protein VLK65_11085 [Vicinamibacteria bacterium]|nr:hypothetical protein [Vicinamibacteria bacterium]
MKRGLIAWDENELPRAVLDGRLAKARSVASSLDVSAVVVYADLWRANPVRSLVNFMPYWGRSLLVVPLSGGTILLCGNSPRVYPWLRTVTYVDELRHSKDFGSDLAALAAEHAWSRIGVLDLSKLPYDVYRPLVGAGLEVTNIPLATLLGAPDPTELSIRRDAAAATRRLVEQAIAELQAGSEHELVACHERALRTGGMEDVIIRVVTDGISAPRPASDRPIDSSTSVVVASEYRGHWVQLSRPVGPYNDEGRARLVDALIDWSSARIVLFDLSGDVPFRMMPKDARIEPGRLVSVHVESSAGRWYGDTCVTESATSARLL